MATRTQIRYALETVTLQLFYLAKLWPNNDLKNWVYSFTQQPFIMNSDFGYKYAGLNQFGYNWPKSPIYGSYVNRDKSGKTTSVPLSPERIAQIKEYNDKLQKDYNDKLVAIAVAFRITLLNGLNQVIDPGTAAKIISDLDKVISALAK